MPVARNTARKALGLALALAGAAGACSSFGRGDDAPPGPSDASLDEATAEAADQVTPDASSADADAEAPPTGVPDGGRRVFVSVATLNPGTGFVGDANDLCRQEAADAGLPGNYVAWLSVGVWFDVWGTRPEVDAIDQLLEWPWYLVDGTLVASGKGELTDGGLRAAIQLDAWGRDERGATSPFVWTGTDPNGRASAEGDCTHWTGLTGKGATGRLDRNDENWTLLSDTQSLACSTEARVYCFQN
jgi:hypothetical protein